MTPKEATSKLNKFRNNHYNDIDEEKREIAQALNVVLPQLEELKRDVARYFELQNMWNWKQRKEWTDELDNEYVFLRTKLSKVGAKDV